MVADNGSGVGVGNGDAATAIGMINTYGGSTYNTVDASSSTTITGSAPSEQFFRIRGIQDTSGTQKVGENGWNSNGPIASQGVQFSSNTTGFSNISVSFDWNVTTQGSANMQVQYSLNSGSTWTTASASELGGLGTVYNYATNSGAGTATVTSQSSSSNTVNGAYLHVASSGGSLFDGVTVNLSDVAGAANDSLFEVRMVNASTGADDVSAKGTALNNDSGNWSFGDVQVSGLTAVPEPSAYGVMGAGALGAMALVRRRRNVKRA